MSCGVQGQAEQLENQWVEASGRRSGASRRGLVVGERNAAASKLSGRHVRDTWRCSLVYRAVMPQKEKPLRQSISLPLKTARRVRSLARVCHKSASRVLVDLVEAGLEAREREKARFFEIADWLARSEESDEQARIKAELARLTFGV